MRARRCPPQFVFDAVYGQEDGAARSKLFSDLLLPMVARFASGFNATVLAYGQTGAFCACSAWSLL